MKTREQLAVEGHYFQCFSYNQMKERFNMHKRITGIEKRKTEFEIELCTKNDNIIAKVHKLLLRFETEDEQVEDCMMKWPPILNMDIWQKMWGTGVKFTC